MILAVTEIDSGRDLCGWFVGIGLAENASTRLLIELDLSRSLNASGDESGDSLGDGLLRFNEFALSAIDGDLDARTLFRTEKNAGEEEGAVVPGVSVAPGAKLDNFSKAFIL
jgi:hypothetical protein